MRNKSSGYKIFTVFNYLFLIIISLLAILPLIYIFSVSFSSSEAVMAGKVGLFPVDFTLESYKYILKTDTFTNAFFVSVKRVVLGTGLSVFLTILLAYPLSKDNKEFRFRTVYVWFFVITMLFTGGLVPTYLTVRATGLIDTIWALVIPGAVDTFLVVILLNFFRNIPKELSEVASLDGAGPWTILWKIYLPISLPCIATVTLFTIVLHWNSYFDGLIYLNNPLNYPLATYLQTLIVSPDVSKLNPETIKLLSVISNRTTSAAQIFIAMIPVLIVYPFLQRFFTTGLTLGSVKG